jgi:hypothetical protein
LEYTDCVTGVGTPADRPSCIIVSPKRSPSVSRHKGI